MMQHFTRLVPNVVVLALMHYIAHQFKNLQCTLYMDKNMLSRFMERKKETGRGMCIPCTAKSTNIQRLRFAMIIT